METIWNTFLDNYCRHSIFEKDDSAQKINSARKLAEDFMARHPNEDLFSVRFDRPDDDMQLTYLTRLSPEEIARLDADGLEECEDICDRILGEILFPVYDEENPWQVEHIELKPVHNYAFTMAVFKHGPSESPVIRNFRVPLSDEEFSAILAWRLLHKDDAYRSFNVMREELPTVFNKISELLEWFYHENVIREAISPYAVFMDEVEVAVKEILAEV